MTKVTPAEVCARLTHPVPAAGSNELADLQLICDAVESHYAAYYNIPPDNAGYLIPTVGTVTTPDPGPLPNESTFVFEVRSATLTGLHTVVAQYEADPQRSWLLRRNHVSGQHAVTLSPDGNAAGATTQSTGSVGAPTLADEHLAQSITINNGSGQTVLTKHHSTDGGATWIASPSTTIATVTPFDSTGLARVGAYAVAQNEKFNGRIYSVELRTGPDPAAGEVLWRFDAADYPGGHALQYTDPRGDTWTVTHPDAITPESRDPHIQFALIRQAARWWTLPSHGVGGSAETGFYTVPRFDPDIDMLLDHQTGVA